jgi:hypothetical protein
MTAQPLAAQPIELVQQGQPAQPAPYPQTHTVVTHQQTVYVHRPVLESMFSAKTVTIVSMVAVILLFLGAIISIQAKDTTKYTSGDDLADKTVAAQTYYKAGITIMAFGAMLLVMFMIGAATISPDIPINVRVALVGISSIVIVIMAVMVLSFVGPLSMTGPTIPGS